MRLFENENDFISWVESIKKLNEKSAINYYEIRKAKNCENVPYNDLSFIASDPIARQQYAKEVMMTSATNRILTSIFSGVMGTINSNDMTVEQNQFLNAHFVYSPDHSLEDKQKMIRNGMFQHGIGDFKRAPLYNRYNFGGLYFGGIDPLFEQVFSDNYWTVEREIFLPELLGVDKKEVINAIKSFTSGNFPVELSSQGKQILFDCLYKHEKRYESMPVDSEIQNQTHSK